MDTVPQTDDSCAPVDSEIGKDDEIALNEAYCRRERDIQDIIDVASARIVREFNLDSRLRLSGYLYSDLL